MRSVSSRLASPSVGTAGSASTELAAGKSDAAGRWVGAAGNARICSGEIALPMMAALQMERMRVADGFSSAPPLLPSLVRHGTASEPQDRCAARGLDVAPRPHGQRGRGRSSSPIEREPLDSYDEGLNSSSTNRRFDELGAGAPRRRRPMVPNDVVTSPSCCACRRTVKLQ